MGHCDILMIQDKFSKHCTALPLKDIKAHTIAHALATKYVALYGCPKIIFSDKGTSFLSKLFNQLGKVLRFHHITTSGYRPQSNGALERSHHVLAEHLKTFTDEFTDWDELLPYAMLSYNTTKIHHLAFDHLEKAKLHSKSLHDRDARPIDIKIGQFVYVEKESKIGKLDQAYTGPYEIVDITEKGNVYLESEDGHHFMKHPNKLKPCAE
ncbi:uncharacterized protein LOC107046612 [Diachasma alloeum]|uniref:uncharacterized protein LOC107046612 n=1 Tax=Diachasma alloeum TaxID=454923 RepID=UPI0007384440|nr:uncharacterized protein LOC107046612 [Diachasma alloeum]